MVISKLNHSVLSKIKGREAAAKGAMKGGYFCLTLIENKINI